VSPLRVAELLLELELKRPRDPRGLLTGQRYEEEPRTSVATAADSMDVAASLERSHTVSQGLGTTAQPAVRTIS
jgi:hypothetical protein